LEFWSWRSVFILNVVLAAAAVAGTVLVVPSTADHQAPRLDVVGAAIAVVGLGALVYSIIEAPTRGWTDPVTAAGLVGGLVVLAAFVGWELRSDHPLIDPRLFLRPVFAAGTVSILLQFLGFFGFVFVAMQYLQLVRGDRPLVAALSVLPMGAAMMPCARLAPVVAARVGSRICCVAGLLLVTAGLVVLSRLDQSTSYWVMVAGLVPLGAGMGLAMTPATAAITDSLPPQLQGVGSAVNDLSRELGGALGIAILGSLLSSTYRQSLTLPGVPAPLADQARSSLGVAYHLGGPVLTQAQQAFVDGMHVAILGGAAAALIAAAAVAALRRSES
jgi:MFS family permease